MSRLWKAIICLSALLIILIICFPGQTVSRNLTPKSYLVTSRLEILLNAEETYFQTNHRFGTMKELVDSEIYSLHNTLHVYLSPKKDDIILHFDMQDIHFFMTTNRRIFTCRRRNLNISNLEFQRLKRIVTKMKRVFEDEVEEIPTDDGKRKN